VSDWSHGYNVSLGYTYGFYRELAPDWLDFCARISGFVPPSRSASGAFRYLEMGSGQGLGLCILAAANPDGEFVGVDFNPEHIAHSNSLAIAAGLTNIRFVEGDFAVLGANWPEELGQFDYVTMHGILSWVPTPVRHALMRCLEHAVPPGGLVYASYNSHPGWVSTLPFQHIARRLQVVGARTGPKAIDDAVALFDKLAESNSTLFKVLPTLKARVDSVRTQNRNYLVQEYLHERWHPFWFSEVAGEMGDAKLSYIGSATAAELMLPSILPKETREIVMAESDPTMRQEVQDCAINQSFRRDIFCRGPRRGFGTGLDLAMDSVVALLNAPKAEPLKVATTFGELAVQVETFRPIIDALKDGPKTLRDLLAVPAIAKNGQSALAQTVILLVHALALGIGRGQVVAPETAHRFNATIARHVSAGAPYGFIAVPALGSALAVSDIDWMLLDTWLEKPGSTQAELGVGLAKRLKALGRSLAHEGTRLEGKAHDERVAAMAKTFRDSHLGTWRKLGAIA
jgi:SAM-dependent methyltransferase